MAVAHCSGECFALLVLSLVSLTLLMTSYNTDKWLYSDMDEMKGVSVDGVGWPLDSKQSTDTVTIRVKFENVIRFGLFRTCKSHVQSVQMIFAPTFFPYTVTPHGTWTGRNIVNFTSAVPRPEKCPDGMNMCKTTSVNAAKYDITNNRNPPNESMTSIYCIKSRNMCDQKRHCEMSDDESACASPFTTPMPCRKSRHSKCTGVLSMDVCVHRRRMCDGINDCGDWSDENRCSFCRQSDRNGKSAIECGAKTCRIGKRCDGITECPNGSDEANCTETNGKPSQCVGQNGMAGFICDGMCQTHHLKCDGILTCHDNTDENNCAESNKTDKTNIGQVPSKLNSKEQCMESNNRLTWTFHGNLDTDKIPANHLHHLQTDVRYNFACVFLFGSSIILILVGMLFLIIGLCCCKSCPDLIIKSFGIQQIISLILTIAGLITFIFFWLQLKESYIDSLIVRDGSTIPDSYKETFKKLNPMLVDNYLILGWSFWVTCASPVILVITTILSFIFARQIVGMSSLAHRESYSMVNKS